MKRRNFISGLAALAAGSCARPDQRRARYDQKECPYCSTEPGVCTYCHGDGKCSYCGGDGVRQTSTKNLPDRSINKVTYDEECPYCKGDGVCRYCEGVGECWACKGTGKIEDWDFEKKANRYSPDKPKKEDS